MALPLERETESRPHMSCLFMVAYQTSMHNEVDRLDT